MLSRSVNDFVLSSDSERAMMVGEGADEGQLLLCNRGGTGTRECVCTQISDATLGPELGKRQMNNVWAL